MYSGMTVYCLKSSQERWTKNWEYHFSPIDVNPNEWIKEIYPNANEGRGQMIFILILVFLSKNCFVINEKTKYQKLK